MTSSCDLQTSLRLIKHHRKLIDLLWSGGKTWDEMLQVLPAHKLDAVLQELERASLVKNMNEKYYLTVYCAVMAETMDEIERGNVPTMGAKA